MSALIIEESDYLILQPLLLYQLSNRSVSCCYAQILHSELQAVSKQHSLLLWFIKCLVMIFFQRKNVTNNIRKRRKCTFRSLPLYPSVMVASSLKSKSSVFSLERRVLKIFSLLSTVGTWKTNHNPGAPRKE